MLAACPSAPQHRSTSAPTYVQRHLQKGIGLRDGLDHHLRGLRAHRQCLTARCYWLGTTAMGNTYGEGGVVGPEKVPDYGGGADVLWNLRGRNAFLFARTRPSNAPTRARTRAQWPCGAWPDTPARNAQSSRWMSPPPPPPHPAPGQDMQREGHRRESCTYKVMVIGWPINSMRRSYESAGGTCKAPRWATGGTRRPRNVIGAEVRGITTSWPP